MRFLLYLIALILCSCNQTEANLKIKLSNGEYFSRQNCYTSETTIENHKLLITFYGDATITIRDSLNGNLKNSLNLLDLSDLGYDNIYESNHTDDILGLGWMSNEKDETGKFCFLIYKGPDLFSNKKLCVTLNQKKC